MSLNRCSKKLMVGGLLLGSMSLLILLLGGCGGAKTASLRNTPPPVAGQVPVKHDMTSATSSARPDWIYRIPADAGGKHFMTGLSNFHSSEQDAREAAMRSAQAQYASYTGVEVSEISEVARFLEGRESDTLDAQISGREQETQKTDALVSRIKAQNYYTETYSDSKRGVFSGTSYKTWVLVNIPVDEDTRVAEWRAVKEQNDWEEIARLKAAAEAELQKLNAKQQLVLKEIEVALSQGLLMQALNQLNQQEQLLEIEQDRFNRGTTELKARGPEIDLLKSELTGKAQSIQARLVLDSGRFGGLLLVPTQGEKSVPVWAWLRHGGGMIPVAELPLVLKSLQGIPLAQATTDPSGRAVFYLPQVASGSVQILVDLGAGQISLLPETFCDGLARANCRLNLVQTGNDLSRSVQFGVQELFDGGAHSKLIAEQIMLGPITYADTGLGGEFPQLFKQRLRQALIEVRGLSLVEPRKRDIQMVENAVRTRGIKMTDHRPAPSIGSAAIQAMMDGADAALEGTYTVQADGIRIDLSLREARTDVVLAAVNMPIPLDAVSAGIELVPAQSGMMTGAGQTRKGAIKVEITSEYGNGQTYTEGDTINYFASLDRDAYLLLVYEDAAGNLLQIFPNSRSTTQRFAAGSAIQVPEKNDPFEFEISAPFGREQVFAFASSKPFPELSGAGHPSGLKVLDINMAMVLKALRTAGNQSGTAYGEAFTVLTTVAKQ